MMVQGTEELVREQVAKPVWGDAVLDRNEQHKLKRQAVLNTAALAFVKNGFHKTSLTVIANELNINKATLYHYFKSKDEILYECHRQAIDSLIGEGNDKWNVEKTGLNKLRMFVECYVGMVTGVFGATLVVIHTNALEPASREKCIEGRRGIDHLLRDIIKIGIKDGSFRKCDPTVTAEFIFGSLNWICHWYQKDGSMNVKQLSDEATTFVMKSLQH